MAKRGKRKGAAREQSALFSEVGRVLDQLNKRVDESTKLTKELVEAQSKLPDILKQLAESSGKASDGIKRFNEEQKKDTRNWASSLVSLELSIRRIQKGFEGIKKTALFADSTAQGVFRFNLMAKAIQESGSLLKGLDLAATRFGVALGEPSKLIESMKTDLASLRWGEGGGGIGKIMEMWGGTFTGYEDAKDLLLELRSVAKNNVNPLDYSLFRQKANNMSVEMFNWLMSGTDDEFEKMLDDNKIKDWDDAVKIATDITLAKGREQAQEQEKFLAEMVKLGSVTKNTHELMEKWNKAMTDNPWMKGIGMGVEVAGDVGSSVLAMKALSDIFKGGKLLGGAKGSAGLATAAKTVSHLAKVGGGLGAGGTIAIIAAVLLGIAFTANKIFEKMEDSARGKKKGESSDEKRAKVQKRLDDANAKLAYEENYGTSYTIAKARNEKESAERERNRVFVNTTEYDQLEHNTKRILGKIQKGAFVSANEWQIIERAKRFSELHDLMKDELGQFAVDGHDYVLDLQKNGVKQWDRKMMVASIARSFQTGVYGDAAKLIGELEQSKTNQTPWANPDIFKQAIIEGRVDKFSPQDKELLSAYFASGIAGTGFHEGLIGWVRDNKHGQSASEYIKGLIPTFPNLFTRQGLYQSSNGTGEFINLAHEKFKEAVSSGLVTNGGIIIPLGPVSQDSDEMMKFREREKELQGNKELKLYGTEGLLNPFMEYGEAFQDAIRAIDNVGDISDDALIHGWGASNTTTNQSHMEYAPNISVNQSNHIEIKPNALGSNEGGVKVAMTSALEMANNDSKDGLRTLFDEIMTSQYMELQETFGGGTVPV